MKAKIKEMQESLAKKYKENPLARAAVIKIPILGDSIDEYLKALTERKLERFFHTKEEYNEEIIKELESHPNSLRAIVMGPHYLHPKWVIDRRSEREDRKSFSRALRTYLEETPPHIKRDIRLIIRNSPRYSKYLIEKSLVNPEEVHDFTHEMMGKLDNLLKLESFSFCCADVGYYENVIITDNSYFEYGRVTEVTQIESFYQSKDPDKIKMASVHFDKVFVANYKGKNEEIARLKQFIMSLKHCLNEDS
jgi:adenine-specific DNA methylase